MLKATAITFIVIFALESSIILIANAFTVFVFWTNSSRLKRTCFLLINLAIADLLVGIAEAVVLVTQKIPYVEKEELKRQSFSQAFHVFASSTSVTFLALISLERVYAVLWPLRHRVTSTRPYIYSIATVWIAGLCMAGLRLFTTYNAKVDIIYASVTTYVFLLISLLIICASYMTIRSRLHCTTPELEVHNQNSTERNLRFSKTFFIVVALSLVFWFPAFVVYTINDFCSQCFHPTALSLVNILHLANSVVNPFVYSFRMPIFKEALKKRCRKRNQNIELRPVFFNARNQVQII
ncbi:adenosine receptor A2a-like [Oculina patagonica]